MKLNCITEVLKPGEDVALGRIHNFCQALIRCKFEAYKICKMAIIHKQLFNSINEKFTVVSRKSLKMLTKTLHPPHEPNFLLLQCVLHHTQTCIEHRLSY